MYKDKRKNKILEIKEKIQSECKEQIYKLDFILKVLEGNSINPYDQVETVIYKLYLQLNNVSLVADEVNKIGFRIKTESTKGQRKYTSNDITQILESDKVQVDRELNEVVKMIKIENTSKNNYQRYKISFI